MRIVCLLIISFLFIPLISKAQLHGIVIDQHTHTVIPEAEITIGNQVSIYSNNQGKFSYSKKMDYYPVQVSHIGYVTYKDTIKGTDHQLIIELLPEYKNIQEVAISISKSQENLKKESNSIYVLVPKLNHSLNPLLIADILNKVPGIFMQQGSVNTGRITIRGIGARNPYGTNRIKAYVGEIPVSSGDGNTILEDIPHEAFSRIEILNGPSSSYYGASLGGTLKMLPAYPDKSGLSFNTSFQSGSYNSTNYNLKLGYKKNRTAYTLYMGSNQSNGYRENSRFENNQLLFSGYIFFSKMEIDYSQLVIYQHAYIPSSLTEEDFNNHPEKAARNWLDTKGYESYVKYIGGVTLKSFYGKYSSNSTTLFGGFTQLSELRPFNILEQKPGYIGIRNTFKFNRENYSLSASFEGLHENIHWKTFENINRQKDSTLQNINEIRQSFNISLFASYTINSKLKTELSLNTAFLQYQLIQSNLENYPTAKHRFKPVLSPKLGLNYSLDGNTNFYTNFQHGFSPPTFEETLLPDGMRNNDLKPESGWSLESGVRTLFGQRITFLAAGYSMWVKNMIVIDRLSEELFLGVNAGKSVHRGIESKVSIEFFKNSLTHNVNLDYVGHIQYNIFTEFISDSLNYSNKHIPGIPKQKHLVQLNWNYENTWFMTTGYTKVGAQYLTDDNSMTYHGYSILNASLAYRLAVHSFKLHIHTGINNMFNQNYASMVLPNAPSFDNSSPRFFYPGYPRIFYMKLTLSY